MVFHGYLVLPATFLLHFVGLGTFYSAAVFVVPLEESFEAGRAVVSLLPSIYLSAALFSSLATGFVQEILSKHSLSVQPVFAVGGLLIGTGSIGSSYGSTLAHVLGFAILTGIGIGLTGFSAAAVCVQWFRCQRGTFLLLAMSGSGFGDYFYSNGMEFLLNWFEEKHHDGEGEPWRQAMRLSGIFSAIIALHASTLMRLPYPMEVEMHEDSEELEQLKSSIYGSGYGTSEEEFDSNDEEESFEGDIECKQRKQNDIPYVAEEERVVVHFHTENIHWSPEQNAIQHLPVDTFSTGSIHDASFASTCHDELKLSFTDALMTRTTVALLIWSTLASFSLTNFFVHVPAFSEFAGLSADAGARALSLTGLSMLLGNVTLGFVVDTVGPIRTLQVSMSTLMILMFLWPFCTTISRLSWVACLYGYAATTQSSVPLVIIANAFGTDAPVSIILALIGVLNISKCMGYLFGPAIVGFLFDLYGDYMAGTLFTGLVMLCANGLLFLIPPTTEQKRLMRESLKHQVASN